MKESSTEQQSLLCCSVLDRRIESKGAYIDEKENHGKFIGW
ncbi:hypothetical protein ACR6LC_002028 [Enterococcus faecalis]